MPFSLQLSRPTIERVEREFSQIFNASQAASQTSRRWAEALGLCVQDQMGRGEDPMRRAQTNCGGLQWEDEKKEFFDHGKRLAFGPLSVAQQECIASEAYAALLDKRKGHLSTESVGFARAREVKNVQKKSQEAGEEAGQNVAVGGWASLPDSVLLGASLGWMWWAFARGEQYARAAARWAGSPNGLAKNWRLANTQMVGMSLSEPESGTLPAYCSGNRASVDCLFLAQALKTGDVVVAQTLIHAGARVSAGGTQNDLVMRALVCVPVRNRQHFSRLFALAQMNGLDPKWGDFVQVLHALSREQDPAKSVSSMDCIEHFPLILDLAMALHPTAAQLLEADQRTPGFSQLWTARHEQQALDSVRLASNASKSQAGLTSQDLELSRKGPKRL